jgi:hypothetical protein
MHSRVVWPFPAQTRRLAGSCLLWPEEEDHPVDSVFRRRFILLATINLSACLQPSTNGTEKDTPYAVCEDLSFLLGLRSDGDVLPLCSYS